MIDALLRAGPYGALHPEKLSLAKLEANPHGIDLGPLRPTLPARLWTKSKRINLVPSIYQRDIDRLQQALRKDPGRAPMLVLVGRRQVRSNNSWLHNSLRLVKGRVACTLLIHPEDASRRGLNSGDRVRLRSRAGSVVVPVEVSDEVGRGIVSLPHGWGHDDERAQLRVANAHAGASINAVTDERFVDALSGTAALSGVEVELEPLS
jgi:anaerobic selenocysteine-containing dehydrogenase